MASSILCKAAISAMYAATSPLWYPRDRERRWRRRRVRSQHFALGFYDCPDMRIERGALIDPHQFDRDCLVFHSQACRRALAAVRMPWLVRRSYDPPIFRQLRWRDTTECTRASGPMELGMCRRIEKKKIKIGWLTLWN